MLLFGSVCMAELGDLQPLGDYLMSNRWLGTPTYDSVQNRFDTTSSAGLISGGGFTDNGNGTLTVAAGTGLIRTTDDANDGLLKSFDWAENTNVQQADDSALAVSTLYYIYIDYNAGSPKVVATDTRDDVTHTTMFLIGKVYKDDTSAFHKLEGGTVLSDLPRRIQERLGAVDGLAHASGIGLTDAGTQHIAISAGVFFKGVNEFTTDTFNSSGTNTFSLWYNDGAWQEVTDQSQIPITQYNDYGTGLADLTPADKYGVYFVYIHEDSDVHVLYGTDKYKLAEAEHTLPPSNEKCSCFHRGCGLLGDWFYSFWCYKS